MSGNNGTHTPLNATSRVHQADDLALDDGLSSALAAALQCEPRGPKKTAQRTGRRGPARGIPLDLFAKHLIVTGMPGAGKTTILMNIMIQLHRRGVHFILIEPVKKEYRLLKALKKHPSEDIRNLARDAQIYTLGNDAVSPGRLGLFYLSSGSREHEHIEHLLHAAMASMPLPGPLRFLLGEVFEEAYEAFRGRERFPAAADLLQAARRVCGRKGYSEATGSDIKTALLTRLGGWTRRALGRLLQTPQSIPAARDLLGAFSIFELDDLPQDEACLGILFLLTFLREALKTLPPGGSGLRFVILLDEAHVVIGRGEDAAPAEDFADPQSFATQYFGRMMAELRALRVGLAIADQHASSLAPSVIKNAGSQLAFRQTSSEDREMLARTMLLSAADSEDLARLAPGQAFFFREGYYRPRRIRAVHLQRELGPCRAPTDEELLQIVRGETWWLSAARERRQSELGLLSEKMADLGIRIKILVGRAVALEGRRVGQPDGPVLNRAGEPLASQARAIGNAISMEIDAFRREAYRPLLGEDIPGDLPGLAELRIEREILKKRFEEAIEPAARGTIEKMQRISA